MASTGIWPLISTRVARCPIPDCAALWPPWAEPRRYVGLFRRWPALALTQLAAPVVSPSPLLDLTQTLITSSPPPKVVARVYTDLDTDLDTGEQESVLLQNAGDVSVTARKRDVIVGPDGAVEALAVDASGPHKVAPRQEPRRLVDTSAGRIKKMAAAAREASGYAGSVSKSKSRRGLPPIYKPVKPRARAEKPAEQKEPNLLGRLGHHKHGVR